MALVSLTYKGSINGIHKSLLGHLQQGLGMRGRGGPDQGAHAIGQLWGQSGPKKVCVCVWGGGGGEGEGPERALFCF